MSVNERLYCMQTTNTHCVAAFQLQNTAPMLETRGARVLVLQYLFSNKNLYGTTTQKAEARVL